MNTTGTRRTFLQTATISVSGLLLASGLKARGRLIRTGLISRAAPVSSTLAIQMNTGTIILMLQ